MKHLSLAAKYRPQKFSEVVGQQMATTALSRAAREDRVAPAYLLSGTRGVGKTTIARIFAKALNCEHAPAEEPCNECIQCGQITSGNHVDVCEIDGASNTGVDDVRALRENVGYMPMQGRYKIFIMDEAHMLSKSAFNALLKTLEEPPGHTVFIFATTEVHRFPATIISRCQHFVFRHQTEDVLLKHLLKILDKEGISHDPGAIRLIARRAAGSVRDSLSLLDQTLALAAGQELNSELVRQSLGLAGLEFFEALFRAIPNRSCAKIVDLCAGLLHDGVDIGFFIRELAAVWRNLFLYKQEGEKILTHLELAPDEAAFMRGTAPAFSLPHLHAAWQMTLENQRSIAQNPEPGPALELLLLNLALLPQLMPVGNVPPMPSPSSAAAESSSSTASHESSAINEETKNYEGAKEAQSEKPEEPKPLSQPSEKSSSADLWREFVAFCASPQKEDDSMPKDILSGLNAQWDDACLRLSFASGIAAQRFFKKKQLFEKSLTRFCKGKLPKLVWEEPSTTFSDKNSFIDESRELPQVKLFTEIMGGYLADSIPKNQENSDAKHE